MRLSTINLLHEPEEPLTEKRAAWRKILSTWRAKEPRFLTSFAYAFAAHVVLLVFLLLARSSSPAGSKESPTDLDTIRLALTELGRDRGDPQSSQAAVLPSDREALAQAIGRSIHFSEKMDLKKKVEIAKAMIRSFIRMNQVQGGTYLDLSKLTVDEIQAKIEDGLIGLPTGEKAFVAKGDDPEKRFEIYTIDREDEGQIARLTRNKDQEREDIQFSGDFVNIPTKYPGAKGVKQIPSEVYFRECPYERILARGSSLFTAVRGFPDFIPPSAKKKDFGMAARPVAQIQPENSARLIVLLINTAPSSEFKGSDDQGSSADFSTNRMAKILDELMKKPEGEQFSDFERDYLKRFDSDSTNLAQFARQFISTNLNGVFYMTDDFAMAFDFLEELYYKLPIYDAYLGYWRRHPKTKTAAEFLFGLAAAYDFERRTLAFLDAVEPEAAEILASGIRRTSAFDYRAKAYVLKKVAEATRADLSRNSIPNIEAALRSYQEASHSIYQLLAEMDGDIRNRALLLLGVTSWEDGEVKKAFEVWRKVEPAYESPTFQFIKPYLAATGDDLSFAVTSIGNFMADKAGEGNEELLRRQLRFHKWANRVRTWTEPQK